MHRWKHCDKNSHGGNSNEFINIWRKRINIRDGFLWHRKLDSLVPLEQSISTVTFPGMSHFIVSISLEQCVDTHTHTLFLDRQRKSEEHFKYRRCHVDRTHQKAASQVWSVTFQTCEQTFWFMFLLRLLLFRTSTSCATGQHWSTWGALTTMQHNHSGPSSLPGQTSQECAKCPISATIHSLDPLKTHHHPPPPPATGEGGGGERDTLSVPATGSTNHRDPRSTTQTNHMRFCFKYNTRNMTVTLTNMTPVVQMRQRRLAARLSAPSKPNLPDCQRLLVALREGSLCFYVNFIIMIITSHVIL